MKVENTQWQEHLTEIDKYMCVGGGQKSIIWKRMFKCRRRCEVTAF